MIIVIHEATQYEIGLIIKEWNYDYLLNYDTNKKIEELYKNYIGENISLIKMRKVNDDTYIIEGKKEKDICIYSNEFKKNIKEIFNYKNDKRINNKFERNLRFRYYLKEGLILPVEFTLK